MERHFHEELKELKQRILKMGLLVDSVISKAIDSFLQQNEKLAKQVLEEEREINKYEIEIDEKGHSLMALGQPMAVDLRSITAILKINTDLERMGDHGVNIAERTLRLPERIDAELEDQLGEMSRLTQNILKDALDSFVDEDVNLARSVLKRDDVVDRYNDDLFFKVSALIERKPAWNKTGIHVITVSHNLERIADLANNIAEDVVYMKQGKEVRHHSEQL